MKLTSIVKIDPKGRVTIPLYIREAMDVHEGKYLVIIADIEKKEIVLTPITRSAENIYEIRVELQDKPGALAEFSKLLSDMKLDVLLSKCSTVKRGEIGECSAVVEPLEPSIDIKSIEEKIKSLDVVYMVSVRPVEKVG
ncbi:MAG: AbrB/MazE/SpoVT family DNA-binding domain-containing protein [Fervidicoccaceae archaeon]|jgi:AbrB family looped-hinge helix DNA binding protein|nr:MAG: AbrB family transcriptional regulator [Fervidicoccus fontis]